jgi:hypothetical protein
MEDKTYATSIDQWEVSAHGTHERNQQEVLDLIDEVGHVSEQRLCEA